MSDDGYIVERSAETPITSVTPRWSRAYPLLSVELALAYCAVGWSGVGLYTGLYSPKSPTGNAFGAAAQFVGSWKVLTTLLIVTALCSVVGVAVDRRALRRFGLALQAFNWGFIAAGLSTLGFVSTAVVVYPALSCLAIATYLTVPSSGSGRAR